MSVKLKILVALLLGASLFYFSCNKPVKSTTNNSAIGSQLAVNLYKSLTGANGGAKVADGNKTPFQVSRNGKQVYGTNPFSCGAIFDTTLNYTTPSHDTTQAYLQHIKYVLTCNGQAVNGYTMLDSVGITTTAPLMKNNITVVQTYNLRALDTTYKVVSMDGSIVNNTAFNTLNSSNTVTVYHKINAYYALSGYTIDARQGISVITSGTSTFTAIQSDLSNGTSSVINYAGTITFVGNNVVQITFTINGGAPQSYKIDVIHGTVIN